MTDKENIKNLLTELIEMIDNGSQKDLDRADEISNIILKALEREPCENTDIRLIHTQGLDEGIRCAMCTNPMANDRGCDGACVVNDIMYKRVMEVIKDNLVDQKPKTGHWILTRDDDNEYCTCSKCGYQNGENWMIGSQIKYCQECGAKMSEILTWGKDRTMVAMKMTHFERIPDVCDDCTYYSCRPHPYKGWSNGCELCGHCMDDDQEDDWIYDGNSRPKNCPLMEIPIGSEPQESEGMI